MSEHTEQVRSLWIPLRQVNMLLPHAVVAEIGNVPALRQAVATVAANPPDAAITRSATIEHYSLEIVARQYHRALLGTGEADA